MLVRDSTKFWLHSWEKLMISNKPQRAGTLTGRVAVVTGGGGTLGQAVAARLSNDGADVALWDLHEAEGGKLVVAVDITDDHSVNVAMRRTIDTLGEIAILVNNAAVQGPIVDALDLGVDDWRRIVDVNLTGTFICSRAVIPSMRAAGYGRVINVASLRGKEGTPKTSAYNASKAGMIALTKTMAKELACTGVLVNCVTPTVIEGGLSETASPDQLAALQMLIPMNRFCRPDEVAAMVAWLASDECSFSTGAIFDISGGRATY
jgi:NAD(P)-dependent dehydrogenase (short-subunit alcohol dehydrogenase family)